MRDFKYPVFVVLTRAPTDELRQIHGRMPLILPKSVVDEWISPDDEPDKGVERTVKEVIVKKAYQLNRTIFIL